MNKAEILSDIANKDFFGAFCGDPEIEVTKPNSDIWYRQNIREEKGDFAVYRNIHFYVVNEGQVEERAFYFRAEPVEEIKTKTLIPFTNKVQAAAFESGNIFIEKVDEHSKAATVIKYIINGSDVDEKRFLVNEDGNGDLQQTRIL